MISKANNGSGNTPSRDEWETPSWIFEPLNKQYQFTFDCCATAENTKILDVEKFSNDFELFSNEFLKYWVCWMNPPFSKAWQMFKHFFKVVKKGVAIYRCDNLETGIWQKIIFPNCSWIFIPTHRVNYEGLDGMGSRFPSALIGFNVDPPNDLDGTLLRRGKTV